MPRLPRFAPLAAALLTISGTVPAAGCGSSDPASPQAQIPGTYSLRTINGQSLPFTLSQSSTGQDEVLSDVYTLDADGTFSEQASDQTTEGGDATMSNTVDAGTWSASGTAITLEYDADGSRVTGVFSGGNTITVPLSGLAAVYRK